MLTIGQFSKIARVTTKSLRYYDEIDLLKPAYLNQENQYRYYATQQLEQILFIQKLKKYDFSLEEIKKVMENQRLLMPLLEEKMIQANQKAIRYSSLMTQIETDMLRLSKGGSLMNNENKSMIEVVEVPPMNLLSKRQVMNVHDSGKVLGEIMLKIGAEKLTPVGPPMFIYHSEDFDPEHYDVEIGIPLATENSETQLFAPGKCARLTYVGPYEEMAQVYVQLQKWVGENHYELNGAPFDIYTSDPQTTAPDQSEAEVYFPIK